MSEADDYGQDEEDHEALEPWEYSDCGMTDDGYCQLAGTWECEICPYREDEPAEEENDHEG